MVLKESDVLSVTAIKVVNYKMLESIIGQTGDCEVEWPPISRGGSEYCSDRIRVVIRGIDVREEHVLFVFVV